MAMTTLEKRLREGRQMLTDQSKKAFGRGKFDRITGMLRSDDGTWALVYDKATKGVYIGDTTRSSRPTTKERGRL